MQYNFSTNWYSKFMTIHKQDNDSFMGNAMTALSLIIVAARLPSCKDTSTTFSNNTVSIRQKEEKKKTFVSLSKPQDLKMWLDVCVLSTLCCLLSTVHCLLSPEVLALSSLPCLCPQTTEQNP
jgi:hypothetical protein